MATLSERETIIATTKKLLDDLAAVDASKLGRVEDLSRTINFSEAVPYLQQMLDMIRQLADRDITRLAFNQLNQITVGCNKLGNLIETVRSFNLNQDKPADACSLIVERIKDAYDEVTEPLAIPLAFTAVQATDYAKIEREAKGYYATIKEESDNLSAFLSKVKDDASKALSAVQEQAAQAGVSTNAHIFTADAGNHSTKAQKWFKATIVVSSVTLGAALCFFIAGFIWTPTTSPAGIQYIINKLVILSALSFGIFWCVRNYKAEKHNQILNQHRANALLTFQAFYEGTADPQVKNMILLQAAQAAFGSRPTGFDSQEKELCGNNPIIDLIGKSMTK